jgi:adenine phosphoribosyltransferase
MPELVAVKAKIRTIPDFPKPGILFRDITPVLQDPHSFHEACEALVAYCMQRDPDVIVAVESRGLIFGAVVAHELAASFVPVRKPGKLPFKTYEVEYALEYGTDAVAMHQDAIEAGQKVVIIDDLLATGGTAAATAQLVEKAGGEVVGLAFLIELLPLRGRAKLEGYNVVSFVRYQEA